MNNISTLSLRELAFEYRNASDKQTLEAIAAEFAIRQAVLDAIGGMAKKVDEIHCHTVPEPSACWPSGIFTDVVE